MSIATPGGAGIGGGGAVVPILNESDITKLIDSTTARYTLGGPVDLTEYVGGLDFWRWEYIVQRQTFSSQGPGTPTSQYCTGWFSRSEMKAHYYMHYSNVFGWYAQTTKSPYPQGTYDLPRDTTYRQDVSGLWEVGFLNASSRYGFLILFDPDTNMLSVARYSSATSVNMNMSYLLIYV